MQQRTKWNESGIQCLTIGHLVLLKESNFRPQLRRTSRIIELHPRFDGISRVACIKTTGGIFSRAVQHIESERDAFLLMLAEEVTRFVTFIYKKYYFNKIS